jgi:hypothetical protein
MRQINGHKCWILLRTEYDGQSVQAVFSDRQEETSTPSIGNNCQVFYINFVLS